MIFLLTFLKTNLKYWTMIVDKYFTKFVFLVIAYFNDSFYLHFQKYDCHDKLPITFCSRSETLSIELEPYYKDIRQTNSKLKIVVTTSLKTTSNDIEENSGEGMFFSINEQFTWNVDTHIWSFKSWNLCNECWNIEGLTVWFYEHTGFNCFDKVQFILNNGIYFYLILALWAGISSQPARGRRCLSW